jgi:YVTN family beta-propeller protein
LVADGPSCDVRARTFVPLAILTAGALSGSSCQRPAPDAAPEVAERGAPLPARGGTRVYVSDETNGRIVVIDAATHRIVRSIDVGKRPRGLRLGPDPRFLFVAVSGSPRGGPGVDESALPPPDRSADGIAVVDLLAGEVARIIESGPDPESFDLSPDGARLYVSNEDAARASIVDVHSGRVLQTVAVGGEPEGVKVSPDGREAWVTSEADARVDVIDTETGAVRARIPTGERPRAVAFSRDGSRAFVTGENAGTLTIADARSHRRIGEVRLPAGARPMDVVASPDGARLYVSTGRHGAVAVVDTAAASLTATIEGVGARPWGLGITPDGKRLYTANGPSGDVSVIDVAGNAVLARIATGGSPWGIAVGP